MGGEVEGEPVKNKYHYHVVSRMFELPELKLLVDAIQSSKFITEKKSNTLRLNHKFCGISDSSRSSVGSYRIASERNIRHQDIRIPVCEES